MRPFVKICGITRIEDAECAIKAGADALGFITFKKSPRYISPQNTAKIISQLSKKIPTVAVTVNEPAESINEYLDAGIDIIQFHGDETMEEINAVGGKKWKALRLHQSDQIHLSEIYDVEMFVIDSFVKDSTIPGGTGKKADWDLAAEFVKQSSTKVLLAGGISAANAEEAMQKISPYGLDLSSGVEIEPGIKSAEKINAFFEGLK